MRQCQHQRQGGPLLRRGAVAPGRLHLGIRQPLGEFSGLDQRFDQGIVPGRARHVTCGPPHQRADAGELGRGRLGPDVVAVDDHCPWASIMAGWAAREAGA